MSVGRLRTGELLVALGVVALAVALASEWSDVGWASRVLALLALVVALVLLVTTAVAQPVSRVMMAGVWATALTTADVVVAAVHAFDAGTARAWLALAAAVVLAAGAWRSISDERTDAPEHPTVAPRVRPAPPA